MIIFICMEGNPHQQVLGQNWELLHDTHIEQRNHGFKFYLFIKT